MNVETAPPLDQFGPSPAEVQGTAPPNATGKACDHRLWEVKRNIWALLNSLIKFSPEGRKAALGEAVLPVNNHVFVKWRNYCATFQDNLGHWVDQELRLRIKLAQVHALYSRNQYIRGWVEYMYYPLDKRLCAYTYGGVVERWLDEAGRVCSDLTVAPNEDFFEGVRRSRRIAGLSVE
ncbi:hypothetical protein M406DRAFT_71488 [Cryphonectria parasitica EP155]|uniref:Uncharacterized protein n=1 Tax=Cryphonectria parasitica (strain ATCC 38755 / EP155) TaxID=660469 RepID=A0A9P5CSL9_CRYP1|nr:uncharacterized protein M406DRAFT_71488 [Cryphonectria parasitica EP155]KAF3768486.1 hypothetical protein M406DRAFT_71488 [Cryphonectria parasitica EP155]